MKVIIAFLFVLFICSGCDNSDPADRIPTGGNGGVVRYWTEYAPIVSYDRQKVYLVADDTITNLYSGVYQASVTNPSRELIFSTEAASAAVRSGFFVYYLQNGKLAVYDMYGDSTYMFTFNQIVSDIVLANDTIIFFCYSSDIYQMNLNNESMTKIGAGLLPTIYKEDTIAYLKSLPDNRYGIMLSGVVSDIPDGEIVIDTFSAASTPLSFAIESQLNRLAYSLVFANGYSINTFNPNTDSYNIVSDSKHYQVGMVDYNTILYTGNDGRLHQTNMDGSSRGPFWGTEE